jgi:hypothetical protein
VRRRRSGACTQGCRGPGDAWCAAGRVALLAVATGACKPSSPSTGGASGPGASDQVSDPSPIPNRRTPASELSPGRLRHTLVLSIDQDFHSNDDYRIALDAWVDPDHPEEIVEVRMWWMDTGKDDERSIFGRGVRRHIDIAYERTAPGSWVVDLVPGSDRYRFEIELDEDGTIEAHAEVEDAAGDTAHRCRAVAAALHARKLVGLPVGLDRIEIECAPEQGLVRRGRLRARR